MLSQANRSFGWLAPRPLSDSSRPGSMHAIASMLLVAFLPIARPFNMHVEMAALALCVVALVFRRVAAPSGGGIWAISAALIALGAFFSGTNSDVAASAYVGLKLALLLTVLPATFAYHQSADPRFLLRCLRLFVIVQSLSAAVGLYQLTGAGFLGHSMRGGRANGLSGHPNVLGLMAAIAILVCVYWLLSNRHRGLAAACVVLNFAALVASGSLSAMSSVIVGGLVLLVSMRRALRTCIAVAVAVPVAVALGPTLGFQPSSVLDAILLRVEAVSGNNASDTGSLLIREATYSAAWSAITDSPIFGVGMDVSNQTASGGDYVVHNYLLRAWFQGGALALVGWLLVTAWSVVKAIRAVALGREVLSSALMATVLVFASTAAFYNQIYYIGLLLFISQIPTLHRSDRPQRSAVSHFESRSS